MGCFFVLQTSHEGSSCQASIALPNQKLLSRPYCSAGQPSRSFLTQINWSPMWAVWSCGRRTSVVQAQRQIHRVLAPYTVGGQRTRFPIEIRHYGDGNVPLLRSVARAHFIDCGFDARRTSHPVAVPKNGWHHNPSFSRSSGSGGRVHPVFRHITATVCNGPPARIQRG